MNGTHDVCTAGMCGNLSFWANTDQCIMWCSITYSYEAIWWEVQQLTTSMQHLFLVGFILDNIHAIFNRGKISEASNEAMFNFVRDYKNIKVSYLYCDGIFGDDAKDGVFNGTIYTIYTMYLVAWTIEKKDLINMKEKSSSAQRHANGLHMEIQIFMFIFFG